MSQSISRFARGILTRLAIPTIQQLLVQRATLVCGSFIVIVLIGAFAFWLPLGLTHSPIRFVDAWFIAMSAMTATGSSSIDITQVCTPIGYAMLSVLIHLGGVGFMSVVLTILQQFGVRVFRSRRVSGWRLLAGAFVIELWVTVLLAVRWGEQIPDPWVRWAGAFWYASNAFANVGFTAAGASPNLHLDIPISAVLAITMLIGSLGLPVLVDVVTRNRRMPQTSVNIAVTLALIVGSAGAIVLNPLWHVSHVGFNQFEKGFVALFEALSWRTSGFLGNDDIMSLSMVTRALLLIGMFLGCAPGAMGGGVTPTTFVVFVSGVYRAFRGDTAVMLMGQRIPPVVVQRAAYIVGLGVAVVMVCTAGLMILDHMSVAKAVMMATTAYATSNVVVFPFAQLHPASLAILSIVMLWGRIGVFAIVLSLYGRATTKTTQTQSVWFG